MRLINVRTFELKDFTSVKSLPQYAILSHTWDGDEVTFQDIADLESAQQKAGFQKIRYICDQAQIDELEYAWVDTCCIDKNSSHELSEAINSMYKWYMNAAVCYVYLSDVPGTCPPLSDEHSFHPSSLRHIEALEESRWFTRGWTLQELIAPRFVYFFGQAWNYIGSLPELIQRVSGITNIQIDVLDGSRPLSDLTIAKRLSWAALRQTSRPEDEAYSLFGILDVNMPLLYGEGRKAFLRLQEEIIRQSTDQSIFAWDAPSGFVQSRELLLAPSPSCFINGSRIRRRRGIASEGAFTMSNKGLEIVLPVVQRQLQEDPARPYVTLGILDCKYEGSPNVLALVMKQHPFNLQGPTPELYVCGYDKTLVGGASQYARIIALNPREAAYVDARALTITKDLQSQTYIQDFSTNKFNWFPIRFTGDGQKYVPTVENVYPEDCWYETSQTMRLRTPEYAYGGVVIRIQSRRQDGSLSATYDEETRHVLVSFGVHSTPSQSVRPSRKIYAMSYIDPTCPVEPHTRWLTGKGKENGADAASLRLRSQQRVVAQLWNGALTVSIENSGDAKTSRAPSIDSLPPPMSPDVTRRKPSFSASPDLAVRKPSFSAEPIRRDSLIQDDQSDRSDGSQDDASYSIHRTKQCENCRYVRAKYKADRIREKEDRRRSVEEEEVKRKKEKTQKQLRTGLKTVRTGATIYSVTGVLGDIAEFIA